MLMLILHYSGLNDYFEVGKDGKMMLKKKKIDLNNLTADELRALGIDPNLSAKEIAKKLKVDALWYCIQIKKLFPKQALVFTCPQYKSFENTVGKGEIARNEQFLLSPQCFLFIWKTFCHFHQL